MLRFYYLTYNIGKGSESGRSSGTHTKREPTEVYGVKEEDGKLGASPIPSSRVP
jgi:hypothetical protein